MKAEIVIGLGYGDEGKGSTVATLCRVGEDKKCVVRFSGGQQAGHTVIYKKTKHVFSNFGAGTFSNVPTYFSEHTTFCPNTILREYEELLEKKLTPELIIHPLAMITTPYDIIANRRCAKTIGDGTCGMGVGKTMERNLTPYKLYAIDLLHLPSFYKKLDVIREEYYKMGLTTYNEDELHIIEKSAIAVETFPWKVENYSYLSKFHKLIFEGSQGVLLDMDHGIFPNVTYSNTTSKNAHKICDILNIGDREMYYVTRAYHTRHGNGVFNHRPITLQNTEEEINVNNTWQGDFKTGKMHYNLLNYAMDIDLIYSSRKVTKRNLVVTCVDQIIGSDAFDFTRLKYHFNSKFKSYNPESTHYKFEPAL
jgi:adenylosuccinate synthase